MAISGWFVLLLALGVVPVALTGEPVVVLGWLGFCVVLAALDLAIAGSPRAIGLSRELPSRVRLGETVAAKLVLSNTGSRAVRAVVRDGWQPSAAASTRSSRITIRRRSSRTYRTCSSPVRC